MWDKKTRLVPLTPGEVKILLLPFCLSRKEMGRIKELAVKEGYNVVVATSTAYALARVREAARERRDVPVRIVGVVCDGRAKKVAVGLLLLKARSLLKRVFGLRRRPVILARVPVNGGTTSTFGRRLCDVGNNTVPIDELREALRGRRVFFQI